MKSTELPVRPIQRGMGLLSIVVVVAVLGAVALVALKAFPAYSEYFAVKRLLQRIAESPATSATDVRAAFEAQRQVDDITSLSPQDLEITREGDTTVISFSYSREAGLVGNASLLFRFDGKVRKTAGARP